MLRIPIVLLLVASSAGCLRVRPHERERLAQPAMRTTVWPAVDRGDQHVFMIRDAALVLAGTPAAADPGAAATIRVYSDDDDITVVSPAVRAETTLGAAAIEADLTADGARRVAPQRRRSIAAAARIRRAIGDAWFAALAYRIDADEWALSSHTATLDLRRQLGDRLVGGATVGGSGRCERSSRR